jgi:hypothetical protein
MDLDGCIDLSFFTLLAEAARCGTLCKFLANLAVFVSLEGFALLSIQPPPDTVHTQLFLMVALTFLSSPHSGRPIRCALQVLADLAVFALLEDTFLFFPLLSVSAQSPSDTVHTVLILMVALTFLLTAALQYGARCKS